jgi:hypothetical protein
MTFTGKMTGTLLVLIATALISLSGCGNQANDSSQTGGNSSEKNVASHEGHDHEEGEHKHEHKHGEWWCSEHAVPEEECTRCDSSLTSAFKKKGDWCEKHKLPDSQCFICNPKLEEKFIARYEAKFGEKPPKREEE